MKYKKYSRRKFLEKSALTGAGSLVSMGLASTLLACNNKNSKAEPLKAEPIIDIHQHTDYSGRNNEQLVAHQRAMGITTTILLPAGRSVISASTHDGVANGLQAKATGNQVCYEIAQKYPGEFIFGANEVPDLADTIPSIEKYLKMGAKVIGESKFGVECDSPEMQKIYQLAQEYNVPVLIHWQHEMYNYGFERFHKMLEKYPKVNFIGHAQTWWANIDKNHNDQTVLYPKTNVTPGGLTDRLLSDYPNMYGDMSAGSGLNSLLRDEDHARGFIERHQDKLLYGSDCNDAVGHGEDCQGARTIAAIRKLSPNKEIERKLLYENSKKLFQL
jgi:predicted TIM-barrel fold metal-dependent hydrolase